MGKMKNESIVNISDLNLFFKRPSGKNKHILKDISLAIKKSKITCLVGETGSGKTIFMKCILGLLDGVVSGKIVYKGIGYIMDQKSTLKNQKELVPTLKNIRGKEISMIFQNASEHLHPLLSIGKQYQLLLKKNYSNLKNENLENVVLKIFNRVRLNHLLRYDTITPFDIYQSPLSGGECQRAMIGMSLCAEKNLQLVLMDELTTDLDASNRDGIIKMIIDLKNKNEKLSILFSSHDLDVVKKLADDIVIMKNGSIFQRLSIETNSAYGNDRKRVWDKIFSSKKINLHPYTHQLKESLVRQENGELLSDQKNRNWNKEKEHNEHTVLSLNKNVSISVTNQFFSKKPVNASVRIKGEKVQYDGSVNTISIINSNSKKKKPLLKINQLCKTYTVGNKVPRKVLNNITLNLYQGEDMAIIGDSGSGKSTLANILVGLTAASAGDISYYWNNDKFINLKNLLTSRYSDSFRRRVQLVFQDCYEALNNKMTVGSILKRTCQLSGRNAQKANKEIDNILEQLCLIPDDIKYKFPFVLSGGEIRRIFIARAFLALTQDRDIPKIMILDEVTRGLDMYVQEIILNLLLAKKKDENITYIYISHDLNMIKMMSSVLAIVFGGNITEILATKDFEKLYNRLHPYTKHLFQPESIFMPEINDACYFKSICDSYSSNCKKLSSLKLHNHNDCYHWIACQNIKT